MKQLKSLMFSAAASVLMLAGSTVLAHTDDVLAAQKAPNGGQQRMAAQFEEVVVATDGVQFEDFLPDRRNTRLNACMGRHQLALPVGRLRLRQGLAVHLAVGIERQVVQRQPLQRHHVVGQLRLERGFQLFTQR